MTDTARAQDLEIITPQQKETYERDGYLVLPGLIRGGWLGRLREASDHFVEQSRALTRSDAVLDLEPDHTAENPRLRRLTSPVDHHPTFEEFSLRGPVADLAIDLLGSPARYHHSKLNYKWSAGGCPPPPTGRKAATPPSSTRPICSRIGPCP
ncbi:MAG: hypothetical protein GY698_03020 [Actinomycetia bacterium]|nr:hypothetical protein [Actinomycetes bacterium]